MSEDEDPRQKIGFQLHMLHGPLFWTALIFFTVMGYYVVTEPFMGGNLPPSLEGKILLAGWVSMCVGGAWWFWRRHRINKKMPGNSVGEDDDLQRWIKTL